ncbi:hypothetical protein J2Z66_007957 [Paenibacillus eucommiae]|uniref:Uncharacterized protein n=1 Tax=Paenibacillus eucommiae TaxID=1355755 RepID=A0ABS4JB53_9BACL|nr:hypothetical protein [Paenibacillus eucommiae]
MYKIGNYLIKADNGLTTDGKGYETKTCGKNKAYDKSMN